MGVFVATRGGQTFASQLPHEPTIAFIRTDNEIRLQELAETFGITVEAGSIPKGIVEAAIVEDNAGRGWILRSDVTKQISMSDPRWNSLLNAQTDVLADTEIFKATNRDRSLYKEWIYTTIPTIENLSPEEQTVLTSLSKVKAVLSLRSEKRGLLIFEKYNADQIVSITGNRVEGPNSITISNPAALLGSASGTDLTGMLGITEAKLRSILPLSGSGMPTIAELMQQPISIAFADNASGTSIFATITTTRLPENLLAMIGSRIPQGEIRRTELKPGVIRTDIVRTDAIQEDIRGWAVTPLQEGWFIAQKEDVLGFGNDRTLLQSTIHDIDARVVAEGQVDLPLVRTGLKALFPFFAIEAVDHPLLRFVNSDASIQWRSAENGPIIRTEWHLES